MALTILLVARKESKTSLSLSYRNGNYRLSFSRSALADRTYSFRGLKLNGNPVFLDSHRTCQRFPD